MRIGHRRVVYAATFQGRPVALKTAVTQDPFDDIPESAENLRNEAALGLRVRSPYVVRTLGYLPPTSARPPFVVTELVRGRTLEEVLAAGRRRTPRRIAELGAQAAAGLAAIHAAGVAHWDCHEGNMLLGDDGVLRIMDFGAALPFEATSSPDGGIAGRVCDIENLGAVLAALQQSPSGTRGSHGRVAATRAGRELARLTHAMTTGGYRSRPTAEAVHTRLTEIAVRERLAERRSRKAELLALRGQATVNSSGQAARAAERSIVRAAAPGAMRGDAPGAFHIAGAPRDRGGQSLMGPGCLGR